MSDTVTSAVNPCTNQRAEFLQSSINLGVQHHRLQLNLEDSIFPAHTPEQAHFPHHPPGSLSSGTAYLLVPLKSKRVRGKEVLQPVSLWRGGPKLLAFLSVWKERDGGRPLAGSKPIHKMLSICSREASVHTQHDTWKQIANNHNRLYKRMSAARSGAAAAPLYNGRISARPPRPPARAAPCQPHYL